MRHSDKQSAVVLNLDNTLPRQREVDALTVARPSDFSASIVRSMRRRGFQIIILSSYPETMRDFVEDWLVANGISYDRLLMNADMSEDSDEDQESAFICGALFDRHVRDYYCVLFAIEGDPVIAATVWAERGIHCL